MPTQLNDMWIQLDNFAGYAGNGRRKISLNLLPVIGGLSNTAQVTVLNITEGGPIMAISPDIVQGVLLIDLRSEIDPIPISKRAVISYGVFDPGSLDPDKTGRIIIEHIGYDLMLPTSTFSFYDIPDQLDLKINKKDLVGIYDLNMFNQAGTLSEFNRCEKAVAKETCCGCEDKEEKCIHQEINFNGSLNLPNAEDNGPASIFETNAKITLHYGGTDTQDPSVVNTQSGGLKKISVDILGKSKEASSLPQIRLHVDIENLFIATSKDEQLCMAADDCYNRLSMQLVVLKDEQPMQYFYIVDQCSSQFQFEKGTDQIEIALKANLCGGNFNQANKNYGSGGDEISIGASLIINLDTNGNVSGYSLDARLETVNDELEEINKRTIIELTGSGTIQDTTDNNGRNISSTGSIIANMNNANMDLQMRTAIDTAFSIQIDNGSPISTSTASATLTINLLDANLVQQSQTAIDTTFSIQIDNSSPISTSAASATLTINFLDANLVQQSRMVFNPQLSLNIDRTNPQTAYDTSLALDITNFDSDLVKTNEQNYSASTSGTLAQTKANTQIANGVLTVNLPNEGTDQIEVNDAPYQLTIQNHNGCTEICGNHSEAIKFTLNRQSGFWNKKEATHKIIYVRKSGTALRIGLIEIKRIERINESNIFFNVAPTNQ